MMDTRESPWGLQGRVQVGHARSHWGPGKDVSKLDTHDSPGHGKDDVSMMDTRARTGGLARTCPSWTRTTRLGHGKDDVSMMDTRARTGAWQGRVQVGHARLAWGMARTTCPSWTRKAQLGSLGEDAGSPIERASRHWIQGRQCICRNAYREVLSRTR